MNFIKMKGFESMSKLLFVLLLVSIKIRFIFLNSIKLNKSNQPNKNSQYSRQTVFGALMLISTFNEWHTNQRLRLLMTIKIIIIQDKFWIPTKTLPSMSVFKIVLKIFERKKKIFTRKYCLYCSKKRWSINQSNLPDSRLQMCPFP